ncbi:hypothetical protein [Marinimicrobium locisalis]|uniref:hypothetical protein n=1 Tax=Marinimicrobium locisalis TaxID=546022 RepID=UPI0032221C6A
MNTGRTLASTCLFAFSLLSLSCSLMNPDLTRNLEPQLWYHPDYGETYVSDHAAYEAAEKECEETVYQPIEIDGELITGASNVRQAFLGYYLETSKQIKHDLKMNAYGEWGATSSVARKYGLTNTASLPDTNRLNRRATEIFQLMDHPDVYDSISNMMSAHGDCMEEKGWVPVKD